VNAFRSSKLSQLTRLNPSVVQRRNLSGTQWKFSSVQPSTVTSQQDDVTDLPPLQQKDYFDVEQLANVPDLFKARVHFGHYKGSRNEHMKPYLFGCRVGVDIIDLNHTKTHLARALNFVAHMAYRRAVILFVHQSSQHGHQVELAAASCGEYSHTRKWAAGLFANNKLGDPETSPYPDVCIFLSTMSGSHEQHPALAECAKVGVATVGIVDTNVNPSLVTYPVPGNDDSSASITHYLDVFTKAVNVGKLRREIDEMIEVNVEEMPNMTKITMQNA